ncbi:zinc-ribbon domain-containing protein [Roseomonas sp. GC11]|uniref:MJ0042-type zinc finger domain-containing protein n=1 Tax=Roseomonas sp. GC11 TaxID=2950546 RepID=UPI0021095F69|nr:zinc-ribbon domain-containing protein [Roseomonas sp. GC11]MCQ4162805.1 zinc-ribbon domain-containing protein [Roseomonas sp. GC11]
MRLECPDCAAAYEVAESLVVPGRLVRCVRCGHGWVPLPAPPRVLTPAEQAAVAQDMRASATPPPAPSGGMPPLRPSAGVPEEGGPLEEGRGISTLTILIRQAPAVMAPPPPLSVPPGPAPASALGVALAWLASLVVLGGGLAALWEWREAVVAYWPPAARLFAAVQGWM